MENESCIKDIISNSLQQVRAIVDADTVVGKQIVTPSGVVIVPISKVSMGFASGGLDIPTKKSGEEASVKNFGGGGGTGVTVAPVGFLVISPEGDVELLPMTPDKSTPIEQVADIINSAPDIIGRIKNIFTKGYSEEEEDAPVEIDELADIEEAYRQKLAQEAADEAEQAIEDTEKLIESDTELTKEDKKRLKKEAKELKRLEKLEKKAAKKAGAISVEESSIEIRSAEDAPAAPAAPVKRGKISQKTLESGRIQ